MFTVFLILILTALLNRKKFTENSNPVISEIYLKYSEILTTWISDLNFGIKGVTQLTSEGEIILKIIEDQREEIYPDELEYHVDCNEHEGVKSVGNLKLMSIKKTKFETDKETQLRKEVEPKAFPAKNSKKSKSSRGYTYFEIRSKRIENIDLEGEENKERNLTLRMHNYGKSRPFLTTFKSSLSNEDRRMKGNPFKHHDDEHFDIDFSSDYE